MNRKVLCQDSKDWMYDHEIFKNGVLQSPSMVVNNANISPKKEEKEEEIITHFKSLVLSPKPLTFLVYKGENNNEGANNSNDKSMNNNNNNKVANNNNVDNNNNASSPNKNFKPDILTRPPFSFLPADDGTAPKLRRPSLGFLQKNETPLTSSKSDEENWLMTKENVITNDTPQRLRRPSSQFLKNTTSLSDEEENITMIIETNRPVWRRNVTGSATPRKFTLVSKLDTEIMRIRQTFPPTKKTEVLSTQYDNNNNTDSSSGSEKGEKRTSSETLLYIPPYKRMEMSRKSDEEMKRIRRAARRDMTIDSFKSEAGTYVPPFQRRANALKSKENVSPMIIENKGPVDNSMLQQKRLSFSPDVKCQFEGVTVQIQPQRIPLSPGSPNQMDFNFQEGEKMSKQAAQERLQKIKIELARR